MEKLRLRIAHLLDKLPGQCWADLVWWALRRSDYRNPWSPIGPSCRGDLARNGACYCGKLRDERASVSVGGPGNGQEQP